MSTLKIRTMRVLRAVADRNQLAERALRKAYNRQKVQNRGTTTQINGRNHTVIRSVEEPDAKRVGVYLRGGCDLPALFRMADFMDDGFRGTCAIKRDSAHIAGSRSDLILQTLHDLDGVPQSALDEVADAFKLGANFFGAQVFEPTFTIEGKSTQEFDKTVVVLSTGPDYTRSLYRHREHGFLVDPGGFWLDHSIEGAMKDMDALRWFNQTYKSVGRLSPEDFREVFGQLVTEIKKRTGAHILVLNVLTVDPSDLTHNYRLIENPDNARRRMFNVALAEMSNAYDFDIVDVDRILKTRGITDQVDFAHPSEQQFPHIAREAHRILVARGIL